MVRLILILVLMFACGIGQATPAGAGGFNDALAGKAAYQIGNYDLAIDNYTRAIRSGELSQKMLAAVFTERAIVHYIQSHGERAIDDYSQALDLDPGYVLAWYNRGIAYWLAGRYDRAIGDYTEALRLDPGYVNAWNERGVSYLDKEQYDRAIHDFDQALRLDPGHTKARSNRDDAYRLKDKGQ